MKELHELDNIAIEMQRIYYTEERYFDNLDKRKNTDRFGFDNVTGNYGTYELEFYLKNDKIKAISELSRMEDFYNEVLMLCDQEGYGPLASARGFDITRPLGRYWTLSKKALRNISELKKMIS